MRPATLAHAHPLRALRARDYRLFFVGQSLSLLGNWISNTVNAWLIYQMTRDPWQVGVLAFAGHVPVLLLAPFAGVWVDRLDRKRLLFWVNALSLVQSGTLACLTFSGLLTPMLLMVLAFAKGFLTALDLPLRQASTLDLVGERSLLPNAIALNSTMFNLARVAGPALAGLLIAVAGPAWGYLCDALSYLPVLLLLRGIHLAKPDPNARNAHPLAALGEGIVYAWKTGPVRRVLALVPVVSLFGFAASILAPVFSVEVFHGSAVTQGLLTSALGLGALGGAVYLGTRTSSHGLLRVVPFAALAFGLLQILYSYASWLPLALPVLVGSGAALVLTMASSNTLLQSMVDDAKRGRVMGLFSMLVSLWPVSSLLVGMLARQIGPQATVRLAAIPCLLGGLLFLKGAGALRRQATALMDRRAAELQPAQDPAPRRAAE